MDAKGWRKCSSPRKMLTEAKGKLSDRQLRLFVCTLARMRWHKMEPGARERVLATERYLDDPEHENKPTGKIPTGDAPGGPPLLALTCTYRDAWESASQALYAIRLKNEVTVPIMRCLFGNPFLPLTVNPAWLAWGDKTVLNLTRSIAETGDHTRLPILADALEDAGCTHEDLIAHLRSKDKHSKNCWAMEALLLAGGSSPPRLLNWPEGPRGHPDWPRSQIRREQPCPICARPGPRMSHLLPGRSREGNVFIHCVLCDHIEWVTTDGLGDERTATLRALEVAVPTCPECGAKRKAFRARESGRAFLRCNDCNGFEWADAGTTDMPKSTVFSND